MLWYSENYVKALDKASSYILDRTEYNGVIIFDIDDTLLLPLEGKPIPECIFFYNWIKSIGFTPVIVTARAGFEQNIRSTIKQLNKLGIKDFPYIFFRPVEQDDVFTYKLQARAEIYNIYKGNVIMSVGDTPWDIGKFGGYGVLLKK